MSVFVVALAAEARPLIDALKLKRLLDKPWQYYSNGVDHLVLTGIGQLNAATACAWLVGRFPEFDREPWINVGIAGHATEEVGSLLWVERLRDSRGDLFPALHSRTKLQGSALTTVDAPSTSYPSASLVDMEGIGFYITTVRFAALELIHLLKVVSDNPSSSLHKFDKATVTDLIARNQQEILDFSASLTQLASSLPEDKPSGLGSCMQEYEQKWRFSHNQKLQLEKLLNRYAALTGDLWEASSFTAAPRDSKQVLALLEEKIVQLPVIMQ